MPAHRLDWSIDPCDAITNWPRDRPLAALVSRGGGALGRWSILGVADTWHEVAADLPLARDALTALLPAQRSDPVACELPFHAGWIGFLCYELGALFEPSAIPKGRSLHGLPLAGGWRCGSAVIHDALDDTWWWTGVGGPPSDLLCSPHSAPHAAHIRELQPEQETGAFAQAVATVRERIRAGDLYQANIAQRWRGTLDGCARRLAATAIRTSGARYGAVIEAPSDAAVISMSPELFLRLDRDGLVTTRPIKGTRPADCPVADLIDSEKDAAELAMIVDLMRNDLARICTPGSVAVESARTIETHPTVHHGVAQIRGHLQLDRTVMDLLSATFPPGSVTGAPKIAAMRWIDELEPVARGPYCGAVGFLADDGTVELNVAIRTITLLPPQTNGSRPLLYSAGCGIVSDSDPHAEEAESVLKCQVLERTAAALDAMSALTPGEAVADAAAPQS